MYGPGVFQTVAFALVPKVNESVHEPFKSGLSIPPQTFGFPGFKSHWFSELGVLRDHPSSVGSKGCGV